MAGLVDWGIHRGNHKWRAKNWIENWMLTCVVLNTRKFRLHKRAKRVCMFFFLVDGCFCSLKHILILDLTLLSSIREHHKIINGNSKISFVYLVIVSSYFNYQISKSTRLIITFLNNITLYFLLNSSRIIKDGRFYFF